MADPWQNGVFGLPPGVDFAAQFTRGFLDRMAGQPPEIVAETVIWANSGRTLTALAEAFDRHGAMLLPRLRIVTDLGAGGGALAPPLARRLELARLIALLLASRPDLGQGQSIPALAQSLTELMVEMQTEGCGPDALARIDPGDHARHWQNALEFLRIAADFHLSGPALDRPARQRAAAEALAADWAAGRNLPKAPVIVAGSTGSHGATRAFMQAVAALPNGAVVLPGYDFDMPDVVWDTLTTDTGDHPQSRYAPFRSGGVRRWIDLPAPAPARNALVSLALRPAPVTDQWIADGPELGDLLPATQNITLVEADQPGQEAEAIAALIRDAVERDQPITLIAADRGLTRRVTAALDRWRILPDDSAGQPLPLSAPGRFLRHLAALPGQPLTIDTLLVLLKHPLTATGSQVLPRNEALRQTRELELELRRNGPAFPDPQAMRDWGSKGDAVRKTFADWLAALVEAHIAPVAADRAPRPIADREGWLRGLAVALAAGPGGDVAVSELWRDDGGGQALAVLDHLARHADAGPPLLAADFADLLHGELQAHALRGAPGAHPLVRFRGPREARTAAHGTVILAGLNEGGWPAAADPDPWLSRPMRVQAGLTLPERLIGLAAHDFQQGIGAERVILTRAHRDAEAETIPSRWLNRMTNLLAGLPDQNGPQALAAMRERGQHWLGMAAVLADPGEAVAAAARPAPIPPLPPFHELPVTDVATLIRDPYAIYARRVLRLRALNPLRPEPGAALRGQALHRIVELLLKTRPDAETPVGEVRDRLLRIAAEVLAKDVPWPSVRAFWMARISRIADRIAADEVRRLAAGSPQVIEKGGAVALPGMDFRLIAKPDRIDLLHDGRAQVYDYKSGAPPTQSQMETFDKQLPLAAAMVERGAFDALGPADVAGIAYIQLGGAGETQDRNLPDAGETWDRFVLMIAGYLSGAHGFTALRAPRASDETGDYAHLARFGEWDLTAQAVPQKVGDGDG